MHRRFSESNNPYFHKKRQHRSESRSKVAAPSQCSSSSSSRRVHDDQFQSPSVQPMVFVSTKKKSAAEGALLKIDSQYSMEDADWNDPQSPKTMHNQYSFLKQLGQYMGCCSSAVPDSSLLVLPGIKQTKFTKTIDSNSCSSNSYHGDEPQYQCVQPSVVHAPSRKQQHQPSQFLAHVIESQKPRTAAELGRRRWSSTLPQNDDKGNSNHHAYHRQIFTEGGKMRAIESLTERRPITGVSSVIASRGTCSTLLVPQDHDQAIEVNSNKEILVSSRAVVRRESVNSSSSTAERSLTPLQHKSTLQEEFSEFGCSKIRDLSKFSYNAAISFESQQPSIGIGRTIAGGFKSKPAEKENNNSNDISASDLFINKKMLYGNNNNKFRILLNSHRNSTDFQSSAIPPVPVATIPPTSMGSNIISIDNSHHFNVTGSYLLRPRMNSLAVGLKYAKRQRFIEQQLNNCGKGVVTPRRVVQQPSLANTIMQMLQ